MDETRALLTTTQKALTINLDALLSDTTTGHVFGQTLIVQNEGNGTTTVNIATPTSTVAGAAFDGDVISFRGTSAVARQPKP